MPVQASDGFNTENKRFAYKWLEEKAQGTKRRTEAAQAEPRPSRDEPTRGQKSPRYGPPFWRPSPSLLRSSLRFSRATSQPPPRGFTDLTAARS